MVMCCVQFYRVEVKVLPPDEAAAPRSRSVLRRFSHFQKLYRIVSATCSCNCITDCLRARHAQPRCWGFHMQGF